MATQDGMKARPASRAAPYWFRRTIVTYYHNPKRYRKAKPEQEFPCGRIVSARPPRKRHYGEIRYGVPDEAQRTELIRQFMERTLSQPE